MGTESGFAAVTALIVMGMSLVIAATVFGQGVHLGETTKEDDAGKRAFQAAESGLNVALNRLDTVRPAAGSCITTGLAAPDPPGSGWCAPTAQESVGAKQLYSYRVSIAPPPGGLCAGDPLDSGTSERCVVAVGEVNGAKRRLEARVGSTQGATPFTSNTSLIGYKQIRIKGGAVIKSNLGTNGKLRKDPGATIDGTVYLGPKATAKGYTGPVVRKSTNFFPAPVSFFNPPSSTNPSDDTAVKNDNHLMSKSSATNVSYVPNPNGRTLTLGDGQSVTLPTGYFNFCTLKLGKNARINIAPGATVRLYIDSRDREGSRCLQNGFLESGPNASFNNPNADPNSLQIFAWSEKTKLTIPNKQNFAGIIYAPASQVKFSGKGKLTGGVAGAKVEIRKDMKLQWVPLVSGFSIPALPVSQVAAWRQCSSDVLLSSADPRAGC